ncbi:hypothetical protein [Alicyclobacillus acidoterrestris]|uniref:Uncharacterized protein n=1 Tax=Alicyclobacillus acidoterrestris (strain ATCC 49025 / DSM 3922 / CIP 106132 / NCIMB 13137 / GD3B) TaxID=1356854 RepID=T0C2V4_ALIAG|nr:hypothetical protein [Alicyclobacillus acidoterrestris]EPZ47364.1 hypothetical protein N007_06455 [Alicyclobacillus acidoterrestris ATCC 49025]UNO49064.1 hypothetical protein K1I37_00400 [Alicyclobacillus acidoterrestris]
MPMQVKLFQSANKNISLLEGEVNSWLSNRAASDVVDIRTTATSFGYSGNETFSWEQLYITVIYKES